MASLEGAFKRHSRAQIATVPPAAQSRAEVHQRPVAPSSPSPVLRSDGVVRRSRVLDVQALPSWLPSSQVAKEPKKISLGQKSLPVLEGVTVPRIPQASLITLQWLDLIQLGKLTQGAHGWLICSTRVEKKMYMLREAGEHVAASVTAKTLASLKHPNIIAAAFMVTSSDVRSFVGFPYIRFTLEELLYVHMKMDESQIQAIAISVRRLTGSLITRVEPHADPHSSGVRGTSIRQ